MRVARRKLIDKAKKCREEEGSFHLRAKSYYLRLKQIDEEDKKGCNPVAYVETHEEDADTDCPTCERVMASRDIARHQAQSCHAIHAPTTQDYLENLAEHS